MNDGSQGNVSEGVHYNLGVRKMKIIKSNHLKIHFVLITTCILLAFGGVAIASGVEFGDFKFAFNGVAALATLGGITSIWFGYKLFVKGIDKNRGELKAKVKFVEILFSGIGPGLFFMAFGAIVLIVSLIMFGVVSELK